MRKTLTHALYLLFVDLVFYCLVVHPVYAFQISSSTTGYVRVASQAAVSAMVTAQRVATLSSVASLVSTSTAGSIGVRLVAGAVGWPALGIVAGVTLAMLYYDATKTAQIKAEAAGPAPWSIPGFTNTFTGDTTLSAVTDPSYSGLYDYALNTAFMPYPPAPNAATCQYLTMPNGWSGPWTFQGGHCVYLHFANPSYNGTDPSLGVPTPATLTQIQTYIGGLPANNPLSIESNTVPVGAQATPTPSDSTASNPVPATELPTAVVPASQVGPTDLVVNPNATPPPGTTQTNTATQPTTGTSTTTTTTTINPDGSTTTTQTNTETETAPVSCATGNHEQRSFGGILQTHLDTWKGSGLLSALNLLSTLVWPTTSPTYTLTSSFLGTFTFDFTAWASMLLAIRSIIIAIAGFVAYKIIFVGGRA